jgi:hypothetical protein
VFAVGLRAARDDEVGHDGNPPLAGPRLRRYCRFECTGDKAAPSTKST